MIKSELLRKIDESGYKTIFIAKVQNLSCGLRLKISNKIV